MLSTHWSTPPMKDAVSRSISSAMRLADRVGETLGVDDGEGAALLPLEWATVVLSATRIERGGDAEGIVPPGNSLVGDAERLLTLLPRRRVEHIAQGWGERGAAGEPGKRGAEPLAVRCVLPLHQEAEPHHLPHEPRRDDRRADLVPDLAAPPDERLLLRDALPLGREHRAPNLVRVTGEPLPCRRQHAEAIVEDRAARHFQ